ncbi:MAG: UDP-2,3-diacylglucosamine diphosphatase [Desulfovibrionaceae bacterium]|nr:UDP-2,3-diacylglucosamine diphosphatase [Desulfovibrionaceae bacterium]
MTAISQFATLPAPAHWRTIDFIADLHLSESEGGVFSAWQRYMLHTSADAVFILGDLFEVWVGDDSAVPGSFEARCGQTLAASAAAGVFFMHGNRDFLMGGGFLARHRVQPLADPTVLTFGGRRYLLTHGDLLCTGDAAYQQFRAQVRNPAWQQSMLARPLAERQAIARQTRAISQQHQAEAGFYAGIDADLARRWLTEAAAATLIHGHTHRPGDHPLGVDAAGQPLTQVTLSDWHVTGSTQRAQVLRLTATGGLQRIAPGQALRDERKATGG